MIEPGYLVLMARYNAWQNRSLIAVAESLSDAERRRDRGAFFGSIFGTFNHLLWADRLWLSRFAGTPPPVMASIPDSVAETSDWDLFRAARREMDTAITGWAGKVRETDLPGHLRWFSGALGREVERPRDMLFVHFFNHQTHHRGQIHAMLTAAGAKTTATDLAFMPEEG